MAERKVNGKVVLVHNQLEHSAFSRRAAAAIIATRPEALRMIDVSPSAHAAPSRSIPLLGAGDHAGRRPPARRARTSPR